MTPLFCDWRLPSKVLWLHLHQSVQPRNLVYTRSPNCACNYQCCSLLYSMHSCMHILGTSFMPHCTAVNETCTCTAVCMSTCMQTGNQCVQCQRGSASGSAIKHTVAPCSVDHDHSVRVPTPPWHPTRPDTTLQNISGDRLPTKHPHIQLAL